MTHAEQVLALLSDGQPHSHRELYRLYVMAHSRVADLRKRGHDIRCWREGDTYLYQLQDPVAGQETSTPLDMDATRTPVEPHSPGSTSPPSRGSATENPSPRINLGAFADGEHAHQEPLLGQLTFGSASGDGTPYASSHERAA